MICMQLSGDHKTITITRPDGEPLSYQDMEAIIRPGPQTQLKMRHLRVLLRVEEHARV